MSNGIAYFFMGWNLGGLFFYLVGRKSGKCIGLALAQKIFSGRPAPSRQQARGQAMSYRLVDLEGHLSPCPNEIWETRESAEQGLRFWERESGMKLKIVEDSIEPEFGKRAEQ